MKTDNYLETAKGYLLALEVIVENMKLDKYTLNPIGLLASQAIELSLKSYLINNGYTEKDLKKIGHNLDDALNEAIKVGFKIKFSHKLSVNVLSLSHDRPYLFRYPQEKIWTAITEPSALCNDVKAIINEVESNVVK